MGLAEPHGHSMMRADRRVASRLLTALALGMAPCALTAQFQSVETSTMRMIYTTPLQSYLVPLVNSSFENGLRFHRELFDYTPDGRINLMMHDLWHYGNAGARPVPENHVTIGIEPYGHDYESAPAPERMASSMNHELAHIVTTDKATAADRFYRSAFFGKVTPNAEVPLSMLYSYLTTPRWYSPRWYLEASPPSSRPGWREGSAAPSVRTTRWCSARSSATVCES